MRIDRVGCELWPGAESMAYELTSDFLSVTVADLGAHLASVVMRIGDDDELRVDVGYPPTATAGTEFHGASIGRYANRIAGAGFRLDGVDHRLEPNEGPNQLHGGPYGFGGYAWSADAETDGATGRVVLQHTSPDGDMGFPGKVLATAVFELTETQLKIDYRAKVDTATPVNLTNHAYWNLGGHGSLDGHELMVAADRYVEVDDEKIPIPGPPVAVVDTRFDCTAGRPLAEVADRGGFDHCFVLTPDAPVHASLRHVSGRRIDLVTNQIGVQVYTGQHLDPSARGVTLETQCLPDTPNRSDFGDCTVRPEDKYLASTTLTFTA